MSVADPPSPKILGYRTMTQFDDDDNSEHDEYFRFTGPARLAKAMHTLHGLVQGVSADCKIKDVELKNLMNWLSSHREFSNRHPFDEVIPRVQKIVTESIANEEERADLLWLCNKFSTDDGYYDDVTSDIQRLQGFLAGILTDGIITEEELASLGKWVDERTYLKRCWPYDELDSIITHVMRDGSLDAQEHEALSQFFCEFASTGGRSSVGVLERGVTVSGVCAMCPDIVFEGQCFCFTGASKRGTREYLASVVAQLGGQCHKNPRNDTNFLIVGADGNPCWAYACYGRKVEDAIERRRRGQKLLIVHEYDFWDAVEDTPNRPKTSQAAG
jgi:hypothetical protein